MRYFYAIMSENVCVGLIDTFNEIDSENYMLIEDYDETLLGMTWTGTEWIETIIIPEA